MGKPKPGSEEVQGPTPSWDALHEVANAQSGYFTAQQAAEAGFSAQLLHKHVLNGRLARPARAVYRITRFPPGENEDLVVLWLWSGQQAVFSHETALRLHDLSDALPGLVHLTLPPSVGSKKRPTGAAIHYAQIPEQDRQWLGPIPICTPRRAVLDVAAGHGDANLVAQAVDQGIRRGLFTATDIAPAVAYVAAAQGWATLLDGGLLGAWGLGEVGDSFWARPFVGVCTTPPPADWPMLAADIGLRHGAMLRVASYSPSRAMHVEFAWADDDVPEDAEINKLRKQLAKTFSWE